MNTVADVLKRIERIKKDLEYVRTFQDKWRDQRDRFPKIYEGILEQEKAFLRKIEDLRNLKVEPLGGEPIVGDEAAPIAAAAAAPTATGGSGQAPTPEDDALAVKPRISAPGSETHAGANGDGPRGDSSDDKRAAAAEIGEKLRKRAGTESPAYGAPALAELKA